MSLFLSDFVIFFTQVFICEFYFIFIHAQLVLATSEIKSEKKEELDVQKRESFWQLEKCSGQVSSD